MITLDDLTDIDKADEQTVVIVNAWLNKRNLKRFDDVPEPIKQAGLELAHAFMNGELLAGRTEGVVTSKSSKAGDVSVSKTYADGADGQAMGQHEMIALALMQPYIKKSYGVNALVGRL
ncbi:hypothetical protein [Moraxella catarrhalis]|uniref:hypothetical protein n=1 Tax=Moraxella catarrhalis TaxID=480 RepID=UPI00128CAF1D|nr:hypothetical protein [Moraxella catarrhalis]MCG6814139.1 hypothetical protein [Moraxella catarrhalis]MPW65906.1 hypothetical protein [Moraxella catarrhalis]MPW89332.1 hypothetical protein [Moraxella catarrhalis]MPX50630.1 hypothetical protein [Moraxella catarrhalis]MPX71478.1 hypothetical protein [Moraxella catarrhalis]